MCLTGKTGPMDKMEKPWTPEPCVRRIFGNQWFREDPSCPLCWQMTLMLEERLTTMSFFPQPLASQKLWPWYYQESCVSMIYRPHKHNPLDVLLLCAPISERLITPVKCLPSTLTPVLTDENLRKKSPMCSTEIICTFIWSSGALWLHRYNNLHGESIVA